MLAGVLAPFLSAAVVAEMSAVGGVILFGMGVNMLELSPRRIKVANMLPAIFLPIAYVPLSNWIATLFFDIYRNKYFHQPIDNGKII